MKQLNYRQCNLVQDGSRVIGWIEERGAKLGASVSIDELGGFWKVENVGQTVRTKSEVKEAEDRARQSFCSLKSFRGNK